MLLATLLEKKQAKEKAAGGTTGLPWLLGVRAEPGQLHVCLEEPPVPVQERP